jgi:site-specific recombinase XerD
MNSTSISVINAPKSPVNALASIVARVDLDALYAANISKDADSSRGTRSPNSERALRNDILMFTGWCTDAGVRHMPASAQTVADFIDAQAAAGKAPASIKRYAASIGAYHRAAAAPNPLDLKIATDALKRMGRAREEKQQQALGIEQDLAL